MSQQTRNTIIGRIKTTAAELQKNTAKGIALTWNLASDFVALQGTYPAGKDGNAAFVAAAATASGKGEQTVKNLVRAYEVREGLSAAQRGGVSDWSPDMVLSLSDSKLSGSQRTAIIKKVQKDGTRSPIEVRKIKRTVAGGSKRTRQTSADATSKLGEKVREEVEKMLANGHDPMSLAAGARLAREYPGDVAAAILFVAANRSKVPAAA